MVKKKKKESDRKVSALFDFGSAELKLIQDAALPHAVVVDGGACYFR